MSRMIRHSGEEWQVEGTGTGHSVGFGILPEVSNWSVIFTCVSDPAKGQIRGSIASPDVDRATDAELTTSLRGALDEAKLQIIEALEDIRWDWRTVDGLAKETGLAPGLITYILESDPNSFIRSRMADREGRALYTARDRYASRRGFLERLRST